jgi:hypothetical protein
MRAAINAKCKDCIYDKLERGTWRQQAGACTITSCSLYEFRPMPVQRKAAEAETHA